MISVSTRPSPLVCTPATVGIVLCSVRFTEGLVGYFTLLRKQYDTISGSQGVNF